MVFFKQISSQSKLQTGSVSQRHLQPRTGSYKPGLAVWFNFVPPFWNGPREGTPCTPPWGFFQGRLLHSPPHHCFCQISTFHHFPPWIITFKRCVIAQSAGACLLLLLDLCSYSTPYFPCTPLPFFHCQNICITEWVQKFTFSSPLDRCRTPDAQFQGNTMAEMLQ